MTPNEKKLYAVFSQVRTCFNRLKTLAEQLHKDLGVSPSMRAVMEALAAMGRQTVPDIAKSKGVSRQHIQAIMNPLQAEGFVESFDNPAHRRSPLFDLSSKGRETFATIKKREEAPLRRLAAAMSPAALEHAQAILVELNQRLAEEIARCDNDGAPR